MLVALPCAMAAAETSAFDGHRKGFTMGFHLGYALVSLSTPEQEVFLVQPDTAGVTIDTTLFGYSGGTGTSDGCTGQFKLGYGFSESIRVCYTTQMDLRGAAIGVSPALEDGPSVVGTTATLALDYYPGGVGGKWYAGAGIGIGDIDGVRGPAYHVCVGRDLGRSSQFEVTLSRYGTADTHNVAARILFGWLWH